MKLAASVSFVAFDSEVVGAGGVVWGVECEEKTRTKRRERNGSEVNCEGWCLCENSREEKVGKDQQIKRWRSLFDTKTNER